MSDGLLLYDGGLLFVDGGLTADPDCCCYYEPAECPPCCIKIDWGTFNVDGDLVDDYVVSTIPIAVKIVMPTKNSRIVCNDDIISVEWELDAAADDYGAWARFGVAWMFNGESPLVGASGETYPWGLVDWVGTSSSTFSVSLKFRKCFLDSAQFHGYIYIGTDFPDWELEIDISRCLSPDLCCEETVACVDCCALLDQEGVIVYDGKYYKVIDSLDADGQMFTAIMEIELAAAGLVCLDGGIDIALHLVPPRHSDIENRTVVTFPAPWILGPYAPDINPIDGSVGETAIDWGTLTVYRYDISLGMECEEHPCESSVTFPTVTVTNTTFNFVGVINFIDCDNSDCCCPVICSCELATHIDSLRCFWPLSHGCLESGLDLWEVGGATQIVNFETVANFNGPIITYVQNGTSEHRFSCYLLSADKWCTRSEYEIMVPVLETSGSTTTQKYIYVSIGNEGDDTVPCNYRLKMDGAEYAYWQWPDQVSSCTMGSYSGNPLGIPGYLFETDFEITGAIACPCGGA